MAGVTYAKGSRQFAVGSHVEHERSLPQPKPPITIPHCVLFSYLSIVKHISNIFLLCSLNVPTIRLSKTIFLTRSRPRALLTFIVPPDFAGGGVGNVPGILMKSNEQARGTPLAGLAVKVTDGFFLVGLSNVDADRARNLQLLKERSWFDVPLVYVNQRRAIIAIEKGAPGERAFDDAFATWGE
jgi:hypothetical protein